MKIIRKMGWSSAFCLLAISLQAQEANEVGQLKKQLQQMQENFDKVSRAQQQQIEALTKKLDEFTKSQTPASVSFPKTEEQKKLEEELTADLAKDAPVTPGKSKSDSALLKPWSASQPLTIARAGSAYMNISFDTLMDAGWSTAADPSAQLQLGDHDPQKRGFSLRNAEIALDGAVDPYFKGFANIVLKLDDNNETAIELEEAYLQ
ncbi:MAG: hypothetical protein ABIQ35_10055, partial [Verrucomicrobiota bacterium]